MEANRWRVFAPQKIDSKSTFRRLPSNQNTSIYSACVLGEWLHYQRHDQHVLSELKWAQTTQYSDTTYFGGLGPCSLHLIFSSDLVKFYLVNPYTVGKISLSSISWYLEVFTFEPFLESYQIHQIIQADRAYGTEISPSSFVISFVILLYAISYNICI